MRRTRKGDKSINYWQVLDQDGVSCWWWPEAAAATNEGRKDGWMDASPNGKVVLRQTSNNQSTYYCTVLNVSAAALKSGGRGGLPRCRPTSFDGECEVCTLVESSKKESMQHGIYLM